MDCSALEGNRTEYSFDAIRPLADSRYAGKTLFILGSSVARGHCSGGYAVGEYLAARLGMKLYKSAVSGTTLCDTGDASYVKRLDAALPFVRPDLFICQLSTNDARLGLPEGDPESDSTDPSDVCGAIRYIIRRVRDAYGCEIYFFTGSKYGSERYGRLVCDLLKIAQKEKIGLLDLWSGNGFNTIPDEKRRLYMKDGVHPTMAGYRDWWGPELERQLLEGGGPR